MRMVPLNEVAGIQPGTPIEAIAGVVCYVGAYKTGTGQYGPWTIQNIEVADGNVRLKIKVTGHDEIDKRRMNRKLYFLSGVDKKGGTAGLKVELDTYKETTSTIVKVTNQATITETGPGEETGGQREIPVTRRPMTVTPTPHSEPPFPTDEPPFPTDEPPFPTDEPEPQPQPAPTRGVHPPVSTGTPDARKAWAKFDGAMNKLRRLRLRTLTVANRIAEDARAVGVNVDAQHIEKIDSWLAIEACRNGLVIDVPDCDPPAPKGVAPESW